MQALWPAAECMIHYWGLQKSGHRVPTSSTLPDVGRKAYAFLPASSAFPTPAGAGKTAREAGGTGQEGGNSGQGGGMMMGWGSYRRNGSGTVQITPPLSLPPHPLSLSSLALAN